MKRSNNLAGTSLAASAIAGMVMSGSGLAADYAPARVPKTGQTACYAPNGATVACEGTGQDGLLQQGMAWPRPRFRDNRNGTVTDRLTKLVWLKNANCPKLGPSLWDDARNKVAKLKNGRCGLADGSAAGQWRLPTVKELQTLVDYRFSATGAPALSDSAGTGPWQPGNAFKGVQNQYYWTSTTASSWPEVAWVVDFGNGGTSAEKKIFNWYVWPVRREGQVFTGESNCGNGGWRRLGFSSRDQCAQFVAAPRFQDNQNGTVTDRYTQLIWLKNAFCTESPFTTPFNRSDWAGAHLSVASLQTGMCGLSDGSQPGDWRLPNVWEMQSLIDYRNSGSFERGGPGGPAVADNGAAFTGIQREYYWTSTTVAGVPDSAWLIDFNLGYVTYRQNKQDVIADIKKEAATNEDLHVVWAVRGGPASPANREQCRNNGWTNFSFNSQAQCIQFVKLRE